MGGGSYDYTYLKRATATARSAGYTDTFRYDHDVRTGKVKAEVHALLDPKKLTNGVRESRDSAEHPNSIPIVVCQDVSGSMSTVPKKVIQKMPSLVGTLVKNGLEDTQVLFSAVGDVSYDDFPFQVSQWETDNRIDEHLANTILEGGGGGNSHESYGLFLYFLARCTKTDHWEKRGEKGYAFLIEDESFPEYVTKEEISTVFGQTIQGSIKFSDLAKEAQEKWNIFIIRPAGTSYGENKSITEEWKKVFPQHVICIDSVDTICETIALAVAAAEGIDLDEVSKSFGTANLDKIKSALVPYVNSGLTKTGKSSGNLDLSISEASERL